MPRARASVVGLRTDNRRNWGNPDGCKFQKHDDAMHMMTWWNATCKQMTWQRQRITGRHLAHRSRGVTTLHHYERISSRDLEWHQRENGREREEVKLSFFFDKRVKPMNLERLNNLKEEYNEMNEVENTPLEKRNKGEQFQAALWLKRKGIE